MNTTKLITSKLVLAATLIAMLAGCASTGPQVKHYPKPPDHAKTATVHYPLNRAHQAAEDSLAVSGFKIKKNDDVFLEAERPRHMGLFVGSGGEICRVWLNQVGDDTEVKVDSAKTFVGMMGQKEWDSTVLAEIIRDLNQ